MSKVPKIELDVFIEYSKIVTSNTWCFPSTVGDILHN